MNSILSVCRRAPRRSIALVATLGTLVLLFAVPAFADNIHTNVVLGAGGNTTITIGGSTSISYYISAASNDGQQGCNAADTTAAVLTLNVPAGVTASPAQLTFTGCGTGNTQSVTFSSAVEGKHAIGASIADAGVGTYDVSRAAFELTVLAPVKPKLTAPVLVLPAAMASVEATGPGGAAVTYSATASDENGALAATCSPISGAVFALGTTTVSCSATNTAGTTSGTFTVEVVDTTPPALDGPSGFTVFVGAPISWNATAIDLVDGDRPVTCTPSSGSVFGPGLTTVSCSAQDLTGNSAAMSFVVHAIYSWSGVLQPVNPDGSSVFKAGSTVPVKFRFTGASAGSSTANATIRLVKLDGTPDGTSVESSSTASPTTGSAFRYDSGDDQYIYNLSTKNQTAGDYRVMINLGDGRGELASQKFSLKK